MFYRFVKSILKRLWENSGQISRGGLGWLGRGLSAFSSGNVSWWNAKKRFMMLSRKAFYDAFSKTGWGWGLYNVPGVDFEKRFWGGVSTTFRQTILKNGFRRVLSFKKSVWRPGRFYGVALKTFPPSRREALSRKQNRFFENFQKRRGR